MWTLFCPIGVWIRGVPLYNAQDTSLIWTLFCPIGVWIRSVPKLCRVPVLYVVPYTGGDRAQPASVGEQNMPGSVRHGTNPSGLQKNACASVSHSIE